MVFNYRSSSSYSSKFFVAFHGCCYFFDHNHVHSLQNFVKSRKLTIFSFTFTYVSGDCRKLSFPPYLFFANKRLVNYVIKTEQVPDMDTCEMLCFNEHNCVSCNFENNVRSDDETQQCELNNSTQQEHEEDFLDTVGFFYHGTDVMPNNYSFYGSLF